MFFKSVRFPTLIFKRNYSCPFHNIPGPKSLPVIGTLHQYFPIIGKYKFDKLQVNGLKKYRAFGEVVREEIAPGMNIVWLFNPRDIESMFRYEGKYPRRRSHLALEKYRLDRPNVYNSGGLLPTNGSEWWRLRSVLQKGLSSPQAVLNFLPITDQITQEWIEQINDVTSDFLPELSRLFLELTIMTFLDMRLNSFSKLERRSNSRSSKLIKSALVTNSCILKLDNGPQMWKHFDTPLYYKLKKAQQYMEEVAIDLLSLQMSLFHEKISGKPSTLLEMYLASPELDFKDIIGMASDFMLAGIDTTSYTSSFLLYNLAKNLPVQSKLFEETKNLLPRKDSKVTKEVLQEASYAKAVLKENFRLRPIAVGTGRVLESDAEFSGFEVPAGTLAVTQNQIISRLEQNFKNAHEFKPERWLRDHPLYEKIDPFLVLPFGHGPRSCIARRLAEQNMLVLLLKLIRNYEITWNGNSLDSRSLLINKPDGPILLNFKKRKN